ncbi:hypothetical protein PPERSA_09208 [Pseudocohnilembus persalinus]|uniref:Uncharacterized protein n=1 Tax=Pseudocohnilembus persalinus TaxID=266149 RepID=A0A0V0R4B3_PSEPJ|nr:hypothetical protein PPERSA_09208 [Pseudocohnilembus persalinus]|eukprot:KRX09324.1 hypothetical protein PPERSA_09208 [Pseudocohnilembus persalinus]
MESKKFKNSKFSKREDQINKKFKKYQDFSENFELYFDMIIYQQNTAPIIDDIKIKKYIEKNQHISHHNIAIKDIDVFKIQYYIQFENIFFEDQDLAYYLFLALEFGLFDLVKEILNYYNQNKNTIKIKVYEYPDLVNLYNYFFKIYDELDEQEEQQQIYGKILDNLIQSNPKYIQQQCEQQVQAYQNMQPLAFKDLIKRQVRINMQKGYAYNKEDFKGLVSLKIKEEQKLEKFLDDLQNQESELIQQQINDLKEENRNYKKQNQELIAELQKQKENTQQLVQDYNQKLKEKITEIKKKATFEILSNNNNFSNNNQNNNQNNYYNNNIYHNNNNQHNVKNVPQQQNIQQNQGTHFEETEQYCQSNSVIQVKNCGCLVCKNCLRLFIMMRKPSRPYTGLTYKCWKCKNSLFSEEDYLEATNEDE